MATKKRQKTWAIVLTVVLSIAAMYIKGQEDDRRQAVGNDGAPSSSQMTQPTGASENSKPADKRSPTMVSTETVKDSDLPKNLLVSLTKVALENDEFDVLKNCSLINHRNNDGDSFHVRHGKKETEFRLYFVDTAESQYKKYRDGNDNGDRIREQGAYFGGLEMQATTEMGKVAKSFVTDLLRKQKFTVVTKWEDVYTPERKYCYVVIKWQGREVYLHELLVAKGLVRLKTRGAALPDNTNYYDQKKNLQEMEKKAKAARLGAWGI